MRLFLAIQLTGEAREKLQPALEAARRAAGESVGFTKLEQLHFTLAFLGEQPGPEEALATGEVLRETRPFDLALSGVGAFPNTARRS